MASRKQQHLLHPLRQLLLALQARDLALRAELAADGSLFDGYHPDMAALHRANAQALRELMAQHGWPDETLAGADGAEAAWLVAQHAIGEPAFMRDCRDRVDAASREGRVPRWQFAYLDDRIRVFEGRPQRFGTQFDITPDGAVIEALEDASQVDAWRRQAGLGPLAEVLARAADEPRPSPQAYADRQAQGARWRRQVGWLGSASDEAAGQDPSIAST